jgi:hypothetical protein
VQVYGAATAVAGLAVLTTDVGDGSVEVWT